MKAKTYTFLTFLLYFLFSCIHVAYSLNGEKDIHFQNLNEKYDLSIRETNSVCSDYNGFIWISSKMGVIRYSISEVKTYVLPYESGNVITTKLTFYNGLLYAYTNNGQVFKYDALKDRFVLELNLAKVLRSPFLIISKLLVDESNRLWISTTSGLFSYDNKNGLKSLNLNANIDNMTWYAVNRLLLAKNSGQLITFNLENHSTEIFYEFHKEKFKSVSVLYPDEETGTIWIGTRENGLYVLKIWDSKELIKIEDVPNLPVLALQSCEKTSLLVGIDGQGVWNIDKNTFEILSVMKEDSDNPNSLKGNGVYDIYCAPDNRVWICTYSGGVSYFDLNKSEITKIRHIINNPQSLVNDDVNSVLEDSNGNLWLATNNGISFQNRKTNHWKTFFHNEEEQAQVFLKLFEDSKGRIWAGSYSSGSYIIDKKTGEVIAHLCQEEIEEDFAGDFVFEFLEDLKGNIWIGGVSGDLICYNYRTGSFKSYEDIVAYVIKELSDEKLIIGTTYGLLLFDKNTGATETLAEGFIVNDICLRKNNVWLATSGQGVICYDIINGNIERFDEDAGITSNFVSSIGYFKGSFWIGTEQGLNKLNEEDNSIESFNPILQMGQVAFNQKSQCVLKNGKLLLGTNKGALILDPLTLKKAPDEGNIFVQDIAVSGRSIRETDRLKAGESVDKLEELTLKYFQNTIRLELLPIGVSSEKTRFSWKMEGLDKRWSKPADNKLLSYSNIPAGKYMLYIRMLNRSNSRVIAERSLELNIIPPYWATWWFRLIVVLFFFVIISFSLFYYVNRLNKLHSEEKIRFFANTAHDIRTSLTLISGPIEELNKESGLSHKGHHYLYLATEQTQRLLKVVTQLMDFQKADIGKEKPTFMKVDIVKMIKDRVMMFLSYATNNKIELSFNTNVNEFTTGIDESLIEKVIDNLISNAIKYSHANTKVQVNLHCFDNKWILEVKDQGIGISKKAQRQLFKEYYRAENVVNSKIVGSGIGLLLVKNYINLHEGKITCSSQLNVGSTFQVVVPKHIINERADIRAVPDTKQTFNIQHKISTGRVVFKESAEPNSTKMKVLIAEDNEYLREFLYSAMNEQFDIYLAENGEQAWDMIEKINPDLVVSDIIMPKMDGFELCEKIKSTYETSHLPVILLTSLAGKAEQIQGLGLRADDYLTKPFDVSILQRRIKTVIQNREVIREKALKLIRRDDMEEVILENEYNDKFLKRMIEVVNDNLSNVQFSKTDFAFEMNVSSSLLYKKAKSLTNQSPTDFIKTIRLDRAIKLIQSKEYTITEVSEMCGFASVGYFSTVFRKHFGESPSQIT